MEKKMNGNEFRDWLDSITVSEYPEIRKRIIEECRISEQKFRHWKAGNSRVPVLAQEKINEIAGKAVFP
jgi:hypothetical protein